MGAPGGASTEVSTEKQETQLGLPWGCNCPHSGEWVGLSNEPWRHKWEEKVAEDSRPESSKREVPEEKRGKGAK